MSGRVLIVDDDELYAKGLSLNLREHFPDWTIEAATTVTSAREFIDGQDPVDVIITDMHMPGNSTDMFDAGEEGLEIVLAGRDKDGDTEIIVLTAHGTLDNVRKALDLGANQYLDKETKGAEEVLTRMIRDRMARVRRLRDLRSELEHLKWEAATPLEQVSVELQAMIKRMGELVEELDRYHDPFRP